MKKYLVFMVGLMLILGDVAMAYKNNMPMEGSPMMQGQTGKSGNPQKMPMMGPNNHMMKGHMMRRGGMMGGMMGNMWREMYIPGTPQFKNYYKFLKENRKTIEELNAKRAEYMALFSRPKPDPKKAAKLAREITRLEEKLQDSAFKYNLPDPCPNMWRGGMMMHGPYRFRHYR